ncbi:DUF6174 domain-containing protein [Colwellia echini]|uniref:Lipoprotein n=1 Tax=Colwellia echini TaxID=1982103 RepID=A0ABY3MT13_9GAMM|nr:DUF6174 domain-containing protein [Colwellia echini]TYK64319.1 hypothetical protein CWS31_016240 [Colwellia echini]
MKFKYLLIAASLFIAACDNKSSTVELELVDVYIPKGDTQCNNDGVSLAETTAYLTDLSIEVSASQCGVITGLSLPDVCGGSTNNIYLHTINYSDLITVENLGFVDLSTLPFEESGYSIIECDSTHSTNETTETTETANKTTEFSEWQSSNISAYSFNYVTNGFSPSIGTWRIQVKDDEVLHTQFIEAGNFEGDLSIDDAPTIDDLILKIHGCEESSSCELSTLEFDQTYHFPTKVTFSYLSESDGVIVSEFEVQ